MPEAIRRVDGYSSNAYTYYPVAIIGAGPSGIAMGCRLKEELGFDQFRIFDRQSGIGGTWWINRYPGVASDAPAILYSFSFKQNPNWTTFYPPGREISNYHHEVCESYNITDKFQLNTDIQQCTWLEDEKIWEIRLQHLAVGMGDLSSKERAKVVEEKGESAVYLRTEMVRAKIVISCVGGLVEPRSLPNHVSGLENFKGKIFHTARWDDSIDLNDKNVVVVGSGCSAAQLLPGLRKAPHKTRSVTQVMRSPPWVVAADPPPGGYEWWNKNSKRAFTFYPPLMSAVRVLVAGLMETQFFQFFGNSPYHARQRKVCEEQLLKRMKSIAPEKYHEILTPDHDLGCKRRICDQGWYETLCDPNVELTTQPLSRVGENSIVLGPGVVYPKNAKSDLPEREIPADVIVLANGFDTTKWLHTLKVQGKGGKDLSDTMDERGGPQAYLGTAMDGFPNFFMIFGPNTGTGHTSVIMASENMVMHSLNFIKPLLQGDVTEVEVKQEAEIAYTSEIQAASKNTVFAAGSCNSWYVGENGWNSSAYPYSQIDFWRRCRFPKWNDWNITYTKQGLARKRWSLFMRAMSCAAVVVLAYRARKNGVKLTDVKGLVVRMLQGSVSRLSYASAMLRNQLGAAFTK